jgi:hypothetical protein
MHRARACTQLFPQNVCKAVCLSLARQKTYQTDLETACFAGQYCGKPPFAQKLRMNILPFGIKDFALDQYPCSQSCPQNMCETFHATWRQSTRNPATFFIEAIFPLSNNGLRCCVGACAQFYPQNLFVSPQEVDGVEVAGFYLFVFPSRRRTPRDGGLFPHASFLRTRKIPL